MPKADYVYKLWLTHGVTTFRETGSINGLSWTLQRKKAAAEHRIDAPRIFACAAFPGTNDNVETIHTPEAAREWLAAVKDRGAEGVKFFGAPPAIMKAALEACPQARLAKLLPSRAARGGSHERADDSAMGPDQFGAFLRAAGGSFRKTDASILRCRLRLQ
jgi:hypothetical protein